MGVALPNLASVLLSGLSTRHEIYAKRPAQPQLLIDYPTKHVKKATGDDKVSS
jgi:hypothetical protein